MKNVAAIILGGGRGTRLYPLTQVRAKPAVPLAAKYRLIDIPMSNCLHSGIEKIYVLTQFNSASLHRHLGQTYRFSPFSSGFVEVLAAQQTPERSDWFQGTADAVRQYLLTLQELDVSDYVILSGDHLYRMDYGLLVDHHRQTKADITLSVISAKEANAGEFGLLRCNSEGRVIEFREKPRGAELKAMRLRSPLPGQNKAALRQKPYLASMGIYVFKKKVLIHLLTEHLQQTDFSKEMIPSALDHHNVQAYLFSGYWEDIGTIEAFYNANLRLVQGPDPEFNFYDVGEPIFTRPRFLPPTVVENCAIEQSMLCDGCTIKEAVIRKSIVGIRSRIGRRTMIEETLLMGADYYQSAEEQEQDLGRGLPPLGIGEGGVIHRAIIDKNARIGKNVQIINRDHVQESSREQEGFWIRNGIVIVIKGALIPDGKVI